MIDWEKIAENYRAKVYGGLDTNEEILMALRKIAELLNAIAEQVIVKGIKVHHNE